MVVALRTNSLAHIVVAEAVLLKTDSAVIDKVCYKLSVDRDTEVTRHKGGDVIITTNSGFIGRGRLNCPTIRQSTATSL